MKMILIFASLAATPAFAASGQYVCTDTCDTIEGTSQCGSAATPAELAKALNSLGCDTSKPISVSPGSTDGLLSNICCVQK